MDSTKTCKWLHETLERLPMISYPFEIKDLPTDGIYFFYEKGEVWGHGGRKPRIVRVGTHRSGNFRSRICDHFIPDKRKMDFSKKQPAPRDRSIFRRNIGRALLHKQKDPYLNIWDMCFTPRESREKFSHLRNVMLEKRIEEKVTKILRTRFSFRFIEVPDSNKFIGSKGIESSIIGTLAHCSHCKQSEKWLGNFSPVNKIRDSGLWLCQHLNNKSLTENEKASIEKLVKA